MSSRTGGKSNSLKQPKEEVNVKYMHKPPTIEPNYGGQKRTILPKSKVSRVLLYDNATQDHMLDIKLANIAIEKERICRLINLHKRSFSMRMMKKQHMKQALSAGNKSKSTKPALSKTAEDSNSKGMPPIQRYASYIDTDNLVSDPTIQSSTNTLEGIKLPAIVDDKRHVIFKVQDKTGNTKVYHTVDDSGIVEDIIPLHRLYPKLIDDPRFRSLQNLLVPLESEM